MKLTFLGTGTSLGIPVIACECAVCQSSDPRDTRLRSSVYVQAEEVSVLVDTTPDFRAQALAHDIRRIDAALMTHVHADHIFGFDDLRRYNTLQKSMIPVFGGPRTITRMKEVFDYVSPEKPRPGFFTPQIGFDVRDEAFELDSLTVTPCEVDHGAVETFGYLLESGGVSIGYFPDVKRLSDGLVERLRGIDVMILDALRPDKEHPTHLTLPDTLQYLERIDAKQSYLIHMCHDFGHAALEAELPDGVSVAYDGLVLEVGV